MVTFALHNHDTSIKSSRGLDLKKENFSKYPLDVGYYKLEGRKLLNNEKYRKLKGMLLYLSISTRPDISASVSILSQRVIDPRDVNLNEVKRVVRYLKGTRNLYLKLSESNSEESMFAYSDSD